MGVETDEFRLLLLPYINRISVAFLMSILMTSKFPGLLHREPSVI